MDRKKLFFRTLANIVRAGGKVIENEEWIAARRRMCEGCEKKKEIEYLPGVYASACGVCKCPLDEKTRTLTTLNKKTLQYDHERCPHPNGDRWAEIDKHYNS